MSSRQRSRDLRLTSAQGSFYNYYANPKTVYDVAFNGLSEVCDDTVGQWDQDNPFSLVKWNRFTPIMNGTLYLPGTQTVQRQFVNYPIGWRPVPKSALSKFPNPSAAQKSDLAWAILSKTNPSTAHVSLPTFIGELKDIPDLVRDWGGSLLKKVAKGHLTWRWAIKPMIRDVKAMLDFHKAVEQRFKWLRELAETRKIRRRVRLYSNDAIETDAVTLHSNGCSITAYRDTLYTESVWGTARWKLIDPRAIPIDVQSRYELAQRLVLGMTSWELVVATWELLPWSWFYDWFLKVGDFLTAMNNTVPVWPDGLCLMRRLTSKSTYRIRTCSSWVTLSGNLWETEELKKREALSIVNLDPTSVPSLPSLTAGQWSILGSLAVLKGKSPKR